VISAWNYPWNLCLGPLVGAIAAGNCVLMKPSEVAENTARLVAELFPRYLDPNCVQVVLGGVPETTLLLRERFDHIMYTGNGAVGKIIMRAAAEYLTPVTLELGGKSPCIVDENCDLAVTARRILWGKFTNAGQTCIAPDYVLAHKNIEPKLLKALQDNLHEFYGENPKDSKDFARIINKRHVQRLGALLTDLGGGEIVEGGQIEEDEKYIAPTIIRNASPDSSVMAGEIFGPILPIMTVPDIQSAIEFINSRPKPLALYIFSGNTSNQNQILANTSSGSVAINETLMQFACPDLPFGGVGDSGMGSYHGEKGFQTFSHMRSVLNKTTWFDLNVRYPPFNENKVWTMRKLI